VLVEQVFKVYLYPDPKTGFYDNNFEEGEDITSGILNVDIIQGNENYEGPYQQIDTGQFTIVSRNPNLDPKINTNLKYNSRIAFVDTRTGEFFRGYVTNIDVQYQRDDDPIITITGTDIFGVMQRTLVNEALHDEIIALADSDAWDGVTFQEFVNLDSFVALFSAKYLEVDSIAPANYPAPQGFVFYVASKEGVPGLDTSIVPEAGLMGFAPAKYIPEVGETLLDVINKYATTNLNSLFPKGQFGYSFIEVYPFVKYNGYYWTPQQDPELQYPTYQFSSDPADGRPYKTILIDNGYNRVTNQLDINNEYRTVTLPSNIISHTDIFGPYASSESIEDYAVTQASVSTIFSETHPLSLSSLANGFATNVFQVVGTPSDEIQKITFDNARYEDIENETTYSNYVVNNFIRIKHQINQSLTIDRFYDIAGITHNITPDEWEMGFTFKPSQQEIAYNYQGQVPTIQMNSLTGDTNFNFTATIANYPTQDIQSVIWDLNQIDANEEAFYYQSVVTGEKFKNGLTRTGLTQTWNFDDDGILAPYSFNPDRGFPGETDNRYGGYGPGNWYVTAYITLTNGFTTIAQQQLVVGTPEVTANFGWAQNLSSDYGQVQFTNTSTNHETGEPDSYFWDFGDGTTSTLQNPVKTYNPAPDQTQYTVSLTVFAYSGDFLTPTKVYNTKTSTITLVQPVMNPNFIFTVSNGSFVQFINTSTNVGFAEPDAWFWQFGDGTTSTLRDPSKNYTGPEGQTTTYNVTLTTRNIWEQTASITKAVTVTPPFTTGTFPVQMLRVRPSAPISRNPGTVLMPYMYFLKGVSSDGQTNLLNSKPMNLEMSLNQIWKNAGGATFATGSSFEVSTLNLTRDPLNTPPAGYGASCSVTNTNSSYWTFETTFSPSIFDLEELSLSLRDVTIASTAQWQTAYVDVWLPEWGWVQIGFFPIGRGPVGNNILGASPGITERVQKIVKNKVLPLNYFNFTYNFTGNNYTATFSPVVSGPYSWLFPGGVTSTATNPTFTFANRGVHYVTLTTPAGTRSEEIYVMPVFPYNFRYIRIKQKLHDGTHQWDTPYIANLKVQTEDGTYVSSGGLTNPQSICSKRITQGTAWSPSYTGATTFDPLNTQNLTNSTGLRFSTTNAGNTSEWDVVIDYKEAVGTRIHDITLDAALPTVSGFAPSVASGISYEIFTTSYTGTFASATNPDNIGGGATWTKLGEINPTAMLQNKLSTYSLIPS
jgi:PKD repeat protein